MPPKKKVEAQPTASEANLVPAPISGKELATFVAPAGLSVVPQERWISTERGRERFEINFSLAPEGDMGVDSGPLTLPTMTLVNAMSKVLQDPTTQIDGLKQGVFYNNRTQEIFADEGFEAVILMKYDERYLTSSPQNISDIVCSSKDGKGMYGLSLGDYGALGIPTVTVKDEATGFANTVGNCERCPHKEFTTGPDGKRVKPRCRHVVWLVAGFSNLISTDPDYLQAIMDNDEEVMTDLFRGTFAIPMASTMLGKGGPFELIMNTARMDRAIFGRRYMLKPVLVHRGQFSYYSISVKPLTPLNEGEKIVARSMFDLMARIRPVLENPLETLDAADRNANAYQQPQQPKTEVTIE